MKKISGIIAGIGLLLIFGTAGASDYATEVGEIISEQWEIRNIILGILLVLQFILVMQLASFKPEPVLPDSEINDHVVRKTAQICKGLPVSCRKLVARNIYKKIAREKDLYGVHECIDLYKVPAWLKVQMIWKGANNDRQ